VACHDEGMSEWAVWRLECAHRATGAADCHENSGFLYCDRCVQLRRVAERVAWVMPIPREKRLRVP
jgi:hypothetical protein